MPARGVARVYYGPAWRRITYPIHWRKPMPTSVLGAMRERRRRLYYRRRKYRAVMGYAAYRAGATPVAGRRRHYY